MRFSKALLLIGLFSSLLCQAQLPKDESGKVVFYEVVEADSLSKENLFQNGRRWVKANDKIKLSSADSLKGELDGTGSVFIYSQSGVFRKLSGRVSYSFAVEVKEGKYRYRFSDFVFHYYERDRYYEMVETNRSKVLEDDKASGWQKKWDQSRKDTEVEINSLIASLSKLMHERPQQVVAPAAKKVDW